MCSPTCLVCVDDTSDSVINIIQSECRSSDISGVYCPITVKFCEKVGLLARGAEKYLKFGYLDNLCHSNQKTSSELIKRLKDYGILTGGALGGKKFVAMALFNHGNRYVVMATKNVHLQVNEVEKVGKMSLCRYWWPG